MIAAGAPDHAKRVEIEGALAAAGLQAPPRQLLIDVSVITRHDAGTGIQRVVRALLNELAALAIDGVVIRKVIASAETEYHYLAEPAAPNDRDAPPELLGPVTVHKGDMFFGLDLAASILPHREAQLSAWRRAGASIHILLYDMLPIESGAWFRWRTRRNFRRWLSVIEREADHVIGISHDATAAFDRWQRRWRLGPRRQLALATVPLSGEATGRSAQGVLPDKAPEILAWIARRPTILMVGTIEPRKGYDQALAAFEILWKSKADRAPALLIVGRPGWKTHRLQRELRRLSSLSGPMLWLDDASDAFLDQLYGHVSGLLFASRGEGFGLPIAEAQARGIPVLARDLPVLREHLGDGARVFSSHRAADLASAIDGWLAAGFPAIGPTPAPRSWRDVAQDLIFALNLKEIDDHGKLPGANPNCCGTPPSNADYPSNGAQSLLSTDRPAQQLAP